MGTEHSAFEALKGLGLAEMLQYAGMKRPSKSYRLSQPQWAYA